ncbi:copi-coated vesicle [Grosmannia clavigera kw1407]|uniref:Copi-coated vesicle n=1 Tax=Grosmannia clavigera (strain kw1407 / UAMH 11150) TaxID=655863 RepID=F0XGM7_GROCL|nr:copi-coated vesicle [Grosmannia clavigera kw1407]EFX02684.1 copi-coated vesicle [Grosmannia clavigera kw1407]
MQRFQDFLLLRGSILLSAFLSSSGAITWNSPPGERDQERFQQSVLSDGLQAIFDQFTSATPSQESSPSSNSANQRTSQSADSGIGMHNIPNEINGSTDVIESLSKVTEILNASEESIPEPSMAYLEDLMPPTDTKEQITNFSTEPLLNNMLPDDLNLGLQGSSGANAATLESVHDLDSISLYDSFPPGEYTTDAWLEEEFSFDSFFSLEAMDFSNIFRIVNLVVGVIMVLGGISQFFPAHFQSIIIGVYVILFGLATALLEFQIPLQVSRYASFLFSFIGRGIFYIFIGSILLHDGTLRIIAGSIIGVIGVIYAVLEFIPSIEPPANMREADAGWGAEQV